MGVGELPIELYLNALEGNVKWFNLGQTATSMDCEHQVPQG